MRTLTLTILISDLQGYTERQARCECDFRLFTFVLTSAFTFFGCACIDHWIFLVAP
jgi:hypothetical protein